jgi:hypothetical protein
MNSLDRKDPTQSPIRFFAKMNLMDLRRYGVLLVRHPSDGQIGMLGKA